MLEGCWVAEWTGCRRGPAAGWRPAVLREGRASARPPAVQGVDPWGWSSARTPPPPGLSLRPLVLLSGRFPLSLNQSCLSDFKTLPSYFYCSITRKSFQCSSFCFKNTISYYLSFFSLCITPALKFSPSPFLFGAHSFMRTVLGVLQNTWLLAVGIY